MNLQLNLRIIAVISAMLGLFQLPGLALAWHLGERLAPSAWTLVITFTLALLYMPSRGQLFGGGVNARDGVVAVILGWIVMILLGSLPYYLSGTMRGVDAMFESASGFTTTGSTVLADVEALPQGLLLWRSISQWIGGMGILLLAVAILPYLGVGGAQIMKAEMPGFRKDKLAPRIADSARILWAIYVGLTVACVLAYHLAGMSSLDALHHAFTTISIGGFSPKNASMGAYGPAVQWCAIVFMILAGINYVLYFQLIFLGEWHSLRDEELKWYGIIMLVGSLFCTLEAFASTAAKNLHDALLHGLFQAVSLVTNTGFANVDWETWPLYVQIILLTIAITGAMSGSTTGGIKIVRAIVLFKVLFAVINRMLTQERVIAIKINGKRIPAELLDSVMALGFAMTLTVAAATIILTSLNLDLATAFSATLATLINVGPGIGLVGPMENFGAIPDPGKWLLIVLMVTGRLEVFTVFILFVPHFWKPDAILK
ncbi:Trk system potassium uptake protein TrkH [Candidatus Magnetaquicoccaceae bacterium FCR-1]|uniref:Trk system potassium uptake protein n=1 Tax=Candidatus Magnetaquiglobus chichijimensis TaxID=3141448 RepID=A0ABQ0C7W3_9PROT